MIEPVELRGGPADGQAFECDPFELPVIVVPLPTRPATINLASFAGLLGPYPVTLELQTARYRRDAISDTSHRWVYRFES